jgi:hypothetical protein
MLWLEKRPLLRFMLAVFALLPACFAIWYFLGAFIAAPAVMLAEPVLTHWLSGSVASVALNDTQMLVMSSFGEADGVIQQASMAGNQLGFPVNTRTLSYSIPLFAALHFATPMRSGWDKFAWSLLLLWLLLSIGLISTTLKDMMLTLGAPFMEQETLPPADVIALLYQFSTLMVPSLAPVLLWAYGAKDSPTFISLLPAALRPAPANDST